MMSHALWLTGMHRAELRKSPIGALAGGDVRSESQFGAISRSTEMLVAAGAVPESEYEMMRARLQDGTFPVPVKYGYAVVGEVISDPRDRIGDTVFCLHPHQNVFDAIAEMGIIVPETIPASRAVLAANMETALNAIWDARIMAGDRVSIVGTGLVGLLVALACWSRSWRPRWLVLK